MKFRRRPADSVLANPQQANFSGPIPSPIEEQLRSAFDALPIGVVISDRTGGRPIHNRAGAAMTGIRHIDILVQDAVEELLATSNGFGSSGSGAVKKTVEIAGPPTRYFAIQVQTLDVGGVMATVEDVTQKILTDTVRTDFVANLSHELKTPVGGIAALGDTMVEESDPNVVKRLAESIVTESYRLSAIVDDLLDLSRIESGATMNWTPVNIVSVINEAIASSRNFAQRHQVEITIGESITAYVYGDSTQLVSALLNLVENGIKYSEANSSVQVHSEIADSEVRISVTDQGIGIAAKDHERVFERFYRVDRARSRATGGTGLGLSIVRHVVTNHGGRIELESEEGLGAAFTMILPRMNESSSE